VLFEGWRRVTPGVGERSERRAVRPRVDGIG
jgi:hypothetical protein